MPDLQSRDEAGFYRCGKCKGNIRYVISEGIPDICPECGYSYAVHGTRSVYDIPSEVKLNLNEV